MPIEILNILNVENVLPSLRASCKREVLKKLSDHAAETLGLPAVDLAERLYERERLGTTGIGDGVAIPHARTGLSSLTAVLARLSEPVDFDAVDNRPVDLVFLLLAPEEADAEHLKALSRIARMLRDQPVRAALRGAADAEAMYAIATRGANAVAA